jgi:hypothetical protein
MTICSVDFLFCSCFDRRKRNKKFYGGSKKGEREESVKERVMKSDWKTEKSVAEEIISVMQKLLYGFGSA